MTTLFGSTASDATNVRPAIGVTPRMSKNRRLTVCDITCSAVPSGPIIATLFERKAAIASNDWFWSAQSAKSSGVTCERNPFG
jgi:hypothetical protein